MPPFALQLYSFRDAGNLEDQLALVCDAGLRRVELHLANFADLAATRAALDLAGMTAISGHVGPDRLSDGGTAVAAAQALGLSGLVQWGFDDADLDPDPWEWEAKGRLLGDHARRLADAGLTLSFHNHD